MQPPIHCCDFRKIAGTLLLGLLVSCETGCLVVPVRTNRLGEYSRKDLQPQMMSELVQGQSTLEQVLLRLGEPDECRDADRCLRYHWERVKWDIFWIAGGGYSAAGGDIIINKNYNLVLSFTPEGVLSEKQFTEQFQPSELETEMNRWLGVPNKSVVFH